MDLLTNRMLRRMSSSLESNVPAQVSRVLKVYKYGYIINILDILFVGIQLIRVLN